MDYINLKFESRIRLGGILAFILWCLASIVCIYFINDFIEFWVGSGVVKLKVFWLYMCCIGYLFCSTSYIIEAAREVFSGYSTVKLLGEVVSIRGNTLLVGVEDKLYVVGLPRCAKRFQKRLAVGTKLCVIKATYCSEVEEVKILDMA